MEGNGRRWDAYGRGGSVNHGLLEEAAKERYVHARFSVYLKDTDAPLYQEWQRKKEEEIQKHDLWTFRPKHQFASFGGQVAVLCVVTPMWLAMTW